jgi:hypothetical protein
MSLYFGVWFMFRASFLFMPIFPNGVVLHISYIVYRGFASASFATGGCISAPISLVPSDCLAVPQLLVTREFQNDRSTGISYMKYVNGRRSGLVTFCVETAFYNGLLKERYKGGWK